MDLRERLKKDLMDAEFRHAYADEHLNLSISTQIKVLREQQKLSQKELAKRLDTKQAGVSRLESSDYSGWSVRVLRKLAEAFDLRLRISFEEFGTLWREVDDFNRKSLERRTFADDPEFRCQGAGCERDSTFADLVKISNKLIEELTSVSRHQQLSGGAQGEIQSINQGRLWNIKKPPQSALAAGRVRSNTKEPRSAACG